MNFEKSLNRLEEIVKILETGNQDLEKMIELFEEGSELIKKCNEKLNGFENKIKVLSQDLDEDLTKGDNNGD